MTNPLGREESCHRGEGRRLRSAALPARAQSRTRRRRAARARRGQPRRRGAPHRPLAGHRLHDRHGAARVGNGDRPRRRRGQRPGHARRPPADADRARPLGRRGGRDRLRQDATSRWRSPTSRTRCSRSCFARCPPTTTPPPALDAAAELVDEVLAEAGSTRGQVIGVGLGLPGPIHTATGTVGSSAILPGWENVRVASEMSRRLELPVHVDNDANLGALAELHWGAGRGSSDARLPEGGHGHRRRPRGRRPDLPRRRRHRRRDRPHDDGRERADLPLRQPRLPRDGGGRARDRGDAPPEPRRRPDGRDGCSSSPPRATSRAAAARSPTPAAHVGHALADLCNLFNPERIVVGGSLGCRRRRPARARCARRWSGARSHRPPQDVDIVPGVLGDRAEMLGAVALVLDENERERPSGRPLHELREMASR